MTHQPNISNTLNAILIKCASKTRVTLLLAIIITTVLFASSVSAQRPKVTNIDNPDVLVLVLCGVGQNDIVSINFSDKEDTNNTQPIMDTLRATTSWNLSNIRMSTKTAMTPNAVPSTSINFETTGIADYNGGTIPIEPFIIALNKYKVIHINYLFPNGFDFKGLLDYRDDYVNIRFSGSQGSLIYKVEVLNNNFEKLDLPLKPANIQKPNNKSNTTFKITIIIILAFVLAFITYIAAARLSQKKAAGRNLNEK